MELVCEVHGIHSITEEQAMAEMRRCDSPWACHKVPGCDGYTEPWEPTEPECRCHAWEWSERDQMWWCGKCGEGSELNPKYRPFDYEGNGQE